MKFDYGRYLTGLMAISMVVSLGCNAATEEQAKEPQQKAAVTAPAGTAPASLSAQDVIKVKLEQARPGLKVMSVTESALPGLYEVELPGGQYLYADAQATHIVAGTMYSVTPSGFVDLVEQKKEPERAALLASLDPKDMIIFSPKGETKAKITVFTDVDCYYCQKLHKEVPALNAMGIEVRYLAYPRAGIGSPSYKKIVTAWCADDPQSTLTALKNKQQIPIAVCDDNPVAEQFQLGRQMGVNGTPALVTDSGKLLPGYMPADRLAQALGVQN